VRLKPAAQSGTMRTRLGNDFQLVVDAFLVPVARGVRVQASNARPLRNSTYIQLSPLMLQMTTNFEGLSFKTYQTTQDEHAMKL
jgi:hypothetical protein